jgi:imidazolonepropionase-like amidohydrolase
MSGSVYPQGFEADLAVLNGDPAKDLAALASVRCTVRAGKIIHDGRLSMDRSQGEVSRDSK